MQGNGIDIGAVYQLLTEVAGKVSDIDARLTAVDARLAAVDARLSGQINVLQRELTSFREQVTHDIASLREAVQLYHGAVVGQGIQYSDVERRVLRIERHLRLEPEDR